MQRKADLWMRFSAIVILSPAGLILLAVVLAPQMTPGVDLGWVLLLLAGAFLALSSVQRALLDAPGASTTAELGLLGAGAGLAAPAPLLGYYFYALLLLSVVLMAVGSRGSAQGRQGR